MVCVFKCAMNARAVSLCRECNKCQHLCTRRPHFKRPAVGRTPKFPPSVSHRYASK